MYILIFLVGLLCGAVLEWWIVRRSTPSRLRSEEVAPTSVPLPEPMPEEEVAENPVMPSEPMPEVSAQEKVPSVAPSFAAEVNVENLSLSDKAARQRLFKQLKLKLDTAMLDDRMYLDPTLTCQGLAKTLNTNYHYLSTYLNQELQVSFTDYVNEFRLQTAIRLLAETDDSIEKVSALSGFNYMSRFHRAFIRRFGCTPGAWRKQRKGKR